MGGEQGDEASVDGADDLHDLAVLGLIEAVAAVLLRDLEAEGPHLPEPLHHIGRDLAVTVDLLGVDFGAQELSQLLDERARWLADVLVGVRIGVDQAQLEVPEEQVPHERVVAPLLLARPFRDAPRFGLGRMRLNRAHRSTPLDHVYRLRSHAVIRGPIHSARRRCFSST